MIFFSQTPEVKALKCINLDRWTFFSLLYMNNGLGRRIPFGFWSSVQSPACMLCPKLQNELVTDTGSIPSVQAFLVKTKVWTWPFIWRKNTEKEQISTEDYFDRSKSRNGYILYLTLFIFYFCFIKRSSCFMIFLRSDSGDTGFQRLTTIPL